MNFGIGISLQVFNTSLFANKGRMGNTKEALRLITHVLEDIHQAIDFCKEYDDEELWNNLIDFALDKPG